MSNKNRNTYTLRVCFDNKQSQLLRAAGYNVCISKLVNGTHNIVWSSQPVSNDNIFQWTEEYGIFLHRGNTYTGNTLSVSNHSPPTEIAFGQTVILDKFTGLSRAEGPLMGNSFAVLNNEEPRCFGLSQKIGGTHQHVYIDQTDTPTGRKTFTPSNTVIVFLSEIFSANNVLTDTGSVTIPVSFASTLEQTVSYVAPVSDPNNRSGIWISGPRISPNTYATTGPGAKALSLAVASGKLSAMTPHQYSTQRGFQLMPHGTDAFKIAELINFFIHEYEPADEFSNS